MNRSAIPISPAPGFIVGPCSEQAFDESQVSRMRGLVQQWALGQIKDWPASGVARLDSWQANRSGVGYFIISSEDEPLLVLGAPPSEGWPPCGGNPRGDVTLP